LLLQLIRGILPFFGLLLKLEFVQFLAQGESVSIHVLSDQTINQISAGEVIENPASVVKELIENSLDAKSETVTIEIKQGGFLSIRISDDGIGMGRDDLVLSLERHATSKIRKGEDLDRVMTMGFRGEALASICAISKVDILSADEKGGSRLIAEGGKILKVEMAPRNRGTTIEVCHLFYNVPARKKFQKSQAASQNAILRVVIKFALAHPQIRVRYFVQGKERLDILPGPIKERAKVALGSPFVQGAFPLHYEGNRIKLEGLLGTPMDGRANRLSQHLFVNGRAVVCPQVSRAVSEGYGTRLSTSLYPSFVLHLTLPPEWIDVNVHPQKREIRLREETVVLQELRRAVMGAFGMKEKVEKQHVVDWNLEIPLTFQEEKPEQLAPTLNFEKSPQDLPVLSLFGHYLMVYPSSLITLPNASPPYDGFLMIDLKGAEARVLFERYLLQKDPFPLQTLMVPITLEFSPIEAALVEQSIEAFKKMGMEIRLFGSERFIIDALSVEIKPESVLRLIEKCLEVFEEKLPEKEREKKLAITLSSYARSRKKGWTILEGKQLVYALLKTSSPYICPKGNKIITHISHDILESYFKKAH